MKWIKTFESISNIGVIMQDIKGILVELKDMGFDIYVDYSHPDAKTLEIYIYKINYSGDPIYVENPSCVAMFEMLFEYTKQNNYVLDKFNYLIGTYHLSDEDQKYEYETFYKVLEEVDEKLVRLVLSFSYR